jgi:hypothetical protein
MKNYIPLFETYIKSFNEEKYDAKTGLSYEEAKIIVKKLKLTDARSFKEYVKTGKLSDLIPSKPDVVYKRSGEWISWGDFLGTGVHRFNSKKDLTYSEAKELVKSNLYPISRNW